MSRLNLCDYCNAYIFAKGKIDLLATAGNENEKDETNNAFKNNASFI